MPGPLNPLTGRGAPVALPVTVDWLRGPSVMRLHPSRLIGEDGWGHMMDRSCSQSVARDSSHLVVLAVLLTPSTLSRLRGPATVAMRTVGSLEGASILFSAGVLGGGFGFVLFF